MWFVASLVWAIAVFRCQWDVKFSLRRKSFGLSRESQSADMWCCKWADLIFCKIRDYNVDLVFRSKATVKPYIRG